MVRGLVLDLEPEEMFGEGPELRVIQELLAAPDGTLTAEELAERAGLGPAAFGRAVPKLLLGRILAPAGKAGYMLSRRHPLVRAIEGT